MSRPSRRIFAPPPCSPLDIKDSLKEDGRLLDVGGFWIFICERFSDKGFLAEGKLMEGGLLKGKELLKGSC
jgi:hypothetical protein